VSASDSYRQLQTNPFFKIDASVRSGGLRSGGAITLKPSALLRPPYLPLSPNKFDELLRRFRERKPLWCLSMPRICPKFVGVSFRSILRGCCGTAQSVEQCVGLPPAIDFGSTPNN
jgi:hypothetical protein